MTIPRRRLLIIAIVCVVLGLLGLTLINCAPRCQTVVVDWTDYDSGRPIASRRVPVATCRYGAVATPPKDQR